MLLTQQNITRIHIQIKMRTGKTSKSHKAKNSRDPEQSREEQPGSSKQKEPPKQDSKKGEYNKKFIKHL